MVFLFHDSSSTPFYYKNKSTFDVDTSLKRHLRQLTRENQNYLISLGFKLIKKKKKN